VDQQDLLVQLDLQDLQGQLVKQVQQDLKVSRVFKETLDLQGQLVKQVQQDLKVSRVFKETLDLQELQEILAQLVHRVK
jgi:hypothetical protein